MLQIPSSHLTPIQIPSGMLFPPSSQGRIDMFSQRNTHFRAAAIGRHISILEAFQYLVLWLFPAQVFNSSCFHPLSPCSHPFLASWLPFQYCGCLHSKLFWIPISLFKKAPKKETGENTYIVSHWERTEEKELPILKSLSLFYCNVLCLPISNL